MQDPKSVERLRHGDAATLKRLFKANHASLFPIAYRLTQNRDVADDVIRAAFRQLWDDRGELDVFDPLDLRLIRYTYRKAMEYRVAHGVNGYGLETSSDQDPEGQFREIANIDGADQLNYLLVIVDGYSFRELARAYDTSMEEVQLSLGRALASLEEITDVES